MNIKSKFIIIMLTCFALISCMTVISAADVPTGNLSDIHSQEFNVHSTNNGLVINQNTEIKTFNSKNNNIQRNKQIDNQNNNKFQNQQSKFNSMEKNTLPKDQNQNNPTQFNKTQSMIAMPQQDSLNSQANMTPNFNDNTLPEIQQPRKNLIPENQNQPMNINEKNQNNTTIPQQPQQNFNNTIPASMLNMTPGFGVNVFDFSQNADKFEPKDMGQQLNNRNSRVFDVNNNSIPQQPQNNSMSQQPQNNSMPQQPQNNFNNPIPQAITNMNPTFNNNQRTNMPKDKVNPKQTITNNKYKSPMNECKPVNKDNLINPINSNQPEDMNNSMAPINSNMLGDMNNMPKNNNISNSQSNDVTYSTNVDGQLFVNGTTTSKNNSNYAVTNSETNTVLVQNGGTLTLSNSKITKTGDTTNSGNSEFLGTNAAILTTYGSTAYIINSTIVTNASGANAIFATNTDSSHSGAIIYVNDTTIDTYQDKSRGLDATYGGTIIADNVTINTRGGSCAALATDRGEGTVIVSNSVLNTGVDNGTGQGSPCVYSTGAITAINCTGTAYGAQIVCIEGKNSITLINSTLYCSGEGNRQENGDYIDLAGVFIYQSMSGDAEVGTAVFNSTNSNLTILSTSDYYTTTPMFYVTNTKGIVTITNTTLNYGSGVLIKVSNQNQWGTIGSNGGDLTFNAINESLNGNIIVGDYSSLSLDLKNSTYKGAITTSSNATSSVTIEAGSTWTLTGDSYLTSLTNYGTIICGNYTLDVNGVKYAI